jgi:hypothetical protein
VALITPHHLTSNHLDAEIHIVHSSLDDPLAQLVHFFFQLVVVRGFENNWHQVAPSGMAKDMHLKRLRFTNQDGFIGTCVEGTANIWYFVATEPTVGCNICYKHWSCHNLIKGSVNSI